MRISDWSSDVCSSDLREELRPGGVERGVRSCERKLCLSDVRTAAEEGRGQAPRKRWGLQARQLSAGPNGSGRTAGQNAQGTFMPRYGKIDLLQYLCRCFNFRFGLPPLTFSGNAIVRASSSKAKRHGPRTTRHPNPHPPPI